jgi:colanic acid/amylovoran biosynthesis glycosyltransferase
MKAMDGNRFSNSNQPKIAHAWADFVPATFVEPHSFLLNDSRYRSLNLVMNLWDNGKQVDNFTHFQRDRDCKNLVNPSFFYRVIRRLTRHLHWKSFQRMCTKYVKRFDIALVHSHFATTGCEIAEPLDAMGIPHIVTLYGYDGSAALKSPATIKKYKRMFDCVDHIIVLSKVVKQRLIDHGCNSNIISVWNMPAGVEHFPYRHRPRGESIRLLMAARFSEAKGQIYALQCLAKLVKKGYSVRLTLVGYGDQFFYLEKLIRDMNLRPYVSLIDNKLQGDFNTEFLGHINEHDIYLAPSIQDRFGADEGGPSLTTVCAQAAGLPVVCTAFPGSEISVIDGLTGLICKERSGDSLAEKVETLILNENLANRIGKAASQLVNREFSEPKQMEKLLAIYDDCLGIVRPKAAEVPVTKIPSVNDMPELLNLRRTESRI